MFVVFYNVFCVVGKDIMSVWVVLFGAGVVGMVIFKLLFAVGVKDMVVVDIDGVIYFECDGLLLELCWIVENINVVKYSGNLKGVLFGVDVFIGVFVLNLLIGVDIVIMNDDAIVFVLVNLIFEVDLVEAGEYVVVVVIGCSDYLN